MAKQSALGNLMPLIILFLVLAVLAAVGFVVYTIATDIAGQTAKKMEKKNVTFTRDGMKVGVKEVTTEQQTDQAQSVLMNVWNNSSWPAYKSKLGWGQPLTKTKSGSAASSPAGTPAGTPGVGTEKRRPFSRTTSTQSAKKA